MTIQGLVARARAELDPFEYRLFDYYLVTGETCGQGIREAAEQCRMSRTRALAARKVLIARGYVVASPCERNGVSIKVTGLEMEQSEAVCVPDLGQSLSTVPEMEQTTVPEMSQLPTTVPDLGRSSIGTVPEMEQSAALAGAREKESFNALESFSNPEKATDKDKKAAAAGAGGREGGVLERPNAFRVFEENIHMLTPVVADTLTDALAEYPAGWTEDAIREAALSGGKTVKYVIGILERWRKEGRAAKPLRPHSSARASPAPTTEKPFTPVGVPAELARKLRNGTV